MSIYGRNLIHSSHARAVRLDCRHCTLEIYLLTLLFVVVTCYSLRVSVAGLAVAGWRRLQAGAALTEVTRPAAEQDSLAAGHSPAGHLHLFCLRLPDANNTWSGVIVCQVSSGVSISINKGL